MKTLQLNDSGKGNISFNGQTIKVYQNDDDLFYNLHDLANILKINVFQFLEAPEQKHYINVIDEGRKKYNPNISSSIVDIHSSTEIYAHFLLSARMVGDNHEIAIWLDDMKMIWMESKYN